MRKARLIFLSRVLHYMKIFEKFLEGKIKSKVKNETPYFKDMWIRYYTKELTNGTIEFWAYPLRSIYYHGEELRPVYLGKYKDDELTKPDNFYELSMPIQRGALRLYQAVGIYQ